MDGVVRNEQRHPGLRRGAPGLAVSVVTDRWSWAGAAGVDGAGGRVGPDSVAAIGDVTKTFVAAEVLHLADTGLVDLEAPVSRYVDHPAASGSATVEQALGMRAGFRDAPGAVDEASADPSRDWATSDALDLAAAPGATPAERPVLSQAGYLALSLLIEDVTGGSLGSALTSDLLEPAGLVRLSLQEGQLLPGPVMVPVSHRPLPPADGYLPYRSLAGLAGGAAGMAGDAPTLARWGYLLYGGHVLDTPWVARMTDDAEPDALPGIGYGLGTMVISTSFGLRAVGHLGSVPGYSSALVVVPERRLSIAVLAVREDLDTVGLVERLTTAVVLEE